MTKSKQPSHMNTRSLRSCPQSGKGHFSNPPLSGCSYFHFHWLLFRCMDLRKDFKVNFPTTFATRPATLGSRGEARANAGPHSEEPNPEARAAGERVEAPARPPAPGDPQAVGAGQRAPPLLPPSPEVAPPVAWLRAAARRAPSRTLGGKPLAFRARFPAPARVDPALAHARCVPEVALAGVSPRAA